MLKPVLALAAGLALSFTALAAQAADVLKVSAIPDEAPTELLRKFKEQRPRDVTEVRSTQAVAGGGGGLFSRLRETFSGR